MKQLLFGMAVATLAVGVSASAHHSYAAYDRTTTVSVEGVIDELEWVAPHVRIMVRGDEGQRYVSEWRAPAALARLSVDRDTLTKGDRVVVTGNPKRDFAESRVINVTSVRRMSDGRRWPAS